MIKFDDMYSVEEELEESLKREKEWKESYMKAMKNWGNCINNNRELQQRIDKAIEYMNNTFDITSVKELFEILNKVEDILRGEK